MIVPLEQQKFILFDVQTTGTQPESSHIIEAGWGLFAAAENPTALPWTVQRVRLPDDVKLPGHIQKLTGLKAEDFAEGSCLRYEDMVQQLRDFLLDHSSYPILIHYARFKRPFLLKAIADTGSPLDSAAWPSLSERIVCTFELAKKNLPQLKSYSLRAVAGYAGYSMGEKKRSRDHLLATAFIWKHLAGRSTEERAEPASLPLHSPELRQKRLALPDQPGVYYFLDRDQRILYVGKASSLKQRLNSYFRGRKTKGSRLNEMLTRVMDFRTQTLDSELAALLLESDEIKRLDPPYNRLLRTDQRTIQKFAWGSRVWGPLLSLWNLQLLQRIVAGMPGDEEPMQGWSAAYLEPDLLSAGIRLLFPDRPPQPADWRALALLLWAERREEEETQAESLEEEDKAEAAIETDPTPEDVANFLRHTLVQVVRQLHRARWILRLVDAELIWQTRDTQSPSRISIHAGVPHIGLCSDLDSRPGIPDAYARNYGQRQELIDLSSYDRLSILISELRKGLRRGDAIRLCLRPGLILDSAALKRHLL